MHRLSNALILRALLISALLAAASSVQAQNKDWDTLYREAQGAFNGLKSEETIAILGRALEVLPEGAERINAQIKTYELRSAAYELARRPEFALSDSQSVLDFTRKRDGGKANNSWLRPMLRCAKLLDQTRKRKEAAAQYQEALELAEKNPENRNTLSLEIMHLYARAQGRVSDWKGACKTLIAYIARLEEKLGKNHADLVGPLKDLARYQRNVNDHAAAIKSLQRWVDIYEVSKGQNSPSTATGLRAIAECHIALREFDTAEKALDRWQSVLERVTKKHPEIVYVLQLRAQIDRLQEKWAEESAHLIASTDRMAALPEPDYTAIGEFRRLLSVSYRKQGKFSEAKAAIDECMKHFKAKLRRTDPQRLMGRLERGRVCFALGEMEAAKKDYDAVLRSWRKLAGDEHRILIAPLEALHEFAVKTRKTARAAELAQWIERIKAKMK